MRDDRRPHPQNAPGPFYVVHGCCTACGVPEGTAPELFGWDAKNHCFVKRQPQTDREMYGALKAVRSAELECIRYRGRDPSILIRFAELGQPYLCDAAEGRPMQPVLRNHVTVNLAHDETAGWRSHDLAAACHTYLRANSERYSFKPIVDHGMETSFAFAWFEDNFHTVRFSQVDLPNARWLIVHHGNLGVSEILHDWFSSDQRFSNVRWYSVEEAIWDGSRGWRDTPY